MGFSKLPRKKPYVVMSLVFVVALLTFCSPLYAAKEKVPDRRKDAGYLDKSIKHISDSDLFAAMDLDRSGLEKVKAAVEAADYTAAYRAWAAYWDEKEKISLVSPLVSHGLSKPISEMTKELRAQLDRVEQVRRNAELLMRHEIKGWGEVTHQHGPVVDFNFNYGTAGKYGFHYWFWASPLLTAYHATGEDKYLAEFDLLFNQWYEQRDAVKGAIRGLDAIWYELGLGSRNRRFLHYYTCPFVDRPLETHDRMLKTALGAARWLYELERQGYRYGNGQLTGSYGLVDIAVRLPEFRESPQWLAIGVRRMTDHIEHDFFDDGCHSERVPTSYMILGYSEPRNLLLLLDAAGIENKSVVKFRKRLEQVLQWWALATNPLGGLPALNDGSGRNIPVSIFREGAALYDRPDFLYVAELSEGGQTKPTGEAPKVTSVNLAPSGAAIMRSGWNRNDNYLFLNYGTKGFFHTHRATHDFEFYGCGAPLALDAGIGDTYDDPLIDHWYRSARAHNMLVVDDANVKRQDSRGRDVLWHSDPQLDIFAATHEGYKTSHALTHRRAIAFLKPDVFVVFDSCTADRDDQILSWYFHSPTDLQVGEAGRIASASGPGVLLMEAWPNQLSDVREGQGRCAMNTPNTPNAPHQIDIDWIAYDKKGQAGNDNRFAVLMLPFSDAAPDVKFVALQSPPGTAALRLYRGETTDIMVFGKGSKLVLLDGRLVTDGAFAWIHEDSQGQRRGKLIGGKILKWNGQAIQEM